MKAPVKTFVKRTAFGSLTIGMLLLGGMNAPAHAADGTWIGGNATAPTWFNPDNWADGVIPGSATTPNSDVATFNNANGEPNVPNIDSDYFLGALVSEAGSVRGIIRTGSTVRTLTLSGAVVNGVANTIARSTGGDRVDFGGTSAANNTLNVVLGGTNNIIHIEDGASVASGVRFYNVISEANAGSGLTLQGSNTGVLDLRGANTFTGKLTVAEGVLSVSAANNASVSGVFGNSALTIDLGSDGKKGALRYTGASVTSSKEFTLVSGGTGEFNITNAAAIYGNGAALGTINGGGTLLKTGPGGLGLNPANTYSGGTIVKEGYVIARGSSTPTASGTVTSGPFGTGTLTLSGGQVRNIAGTTILNAIHADAETTSALLSISGTFVFNGALSGSGTIDNGADPAVAQNQVRINGNLGGFTGTIRHNHGSQSGTGTNTDSLRFNGTELGGGYNGSNARFIFDGSTSSEGNTRIVTENGATFQMGKLSGTGGYLRDDLNDAGLNQEMTLEVGHLDDEDSSWDGVFADQNTNNGTTAHFTKVGGKSLALGGNNAYKGVTTVSEGTLLVNGNPTGGGAYTVASGATLGGTGNLGLSAVSVAASGVLAPGDSRPSSTSVGEFSVGSAVIDGTLKIEFGNHSIDHLSLPFGSLDLTNATLDLSAIGDLANGAYVFLTYGSLVNGNEFANLPTLPGTLSIHHDPFARTFSLVGEYVHSLPGDFNGDLVVNAADYVVWRDTMSDQPGKYDEWKANFGAGSGGGAVVGGQTAVPEPASLALAACLALGVVGYRWRRES